MSEDKTKARFEKALTYQLHGDFLKSQSGFEKLLSHSIVNQKLKAQILNSNGVNLFNQNKPDKALASHQESLKIARLINNKKLEAQALVELSRVLYHTKGKFDEAKVHLEKSLEIGRELNDELIIADSLRNIGVVLWWGKGELDRPLKEFYEPALELYRKNGDLRSEATMLSNISLIHSFKGDIFTQIKLQNESLALRQKIGDQAGISESYNALGTAYGGMRNFRKARGYLQKSVKLSKRIGFQLSQNEAESYLAGVYTKLGEYDKASALFTQILEREAYSPGLAKFRMVSIGFNQLLKGNLEKAEEIYKRVLDVELKSDSRDVRLLTSLNVVLGDIYLRLGRLDEARKILNKAQYLHEKHDTAAIKGYFHFGVVQAEMSYEDERYDEGLKFLEKAADDELILFSSSGTNVVNSPLQVTYDRLFSLLLEKLDKEIDPSEDGNRLSDELVFRFLEQRRYRSFRNFIVRSSSKNITTTQTSDAEKSALAKIAKIKSYLEKDNVLSLRKSLRNAYSEYENAVVKEQFSREVQRAITTAQPIDLKTVQKNLRESTALIEYVFSGEKVFALVITESGLRSFALPVSRSNLQNKVRLLQSSMFSSGRSEETNDWNPIAQSLRESLIHPIEKSGILKDIDRLAIIPFGFLHDLPFAALGGNESHQIRFLVEDYVLFFPPSATFMTVAQDSKQSKNLIAFGRNASNRDLPPLKFAVEESKSVAQIFSGNAKIENGATETDFKRLASKASHLHIATHAIAEPEMPLFSRLLLNHSEKDDGNLTTREIFELGIDASLVTIAACEGAASFSADSRGLVEVDRIGLTEAFLHAGSKSVLASLSPVSDRATTDLMKNFYQNLLTKDKAKSLALAQRAMLHDETNRKFTHPRYWANFVLIGTDR